MKQREGIDENGIGLELTDNNKLKMQNALIDQ